MVWKLYEDDLLLDELPDDEVSLDPQPEGSLDPGRVEFAASASLRPFGQYSLIHDSELCWTIVVNADSDFVGGKIRAEIISCDRDS